MSNSSINTLYIYGGEENKKVNRQKDFYCYQLNSGGIIGNCTSLNDSKKYLYLSKELRDQYVEYIFSLNELFISSDLIHDKSLSLFFLTDISNKRTELYETYQSICHLNIIKEKIKEKKIRFIILDQITESVYSSIKSSDIKNCDIKIMKINNKKISSFYLLFNQFTFFIKSIIFSVIIKFIGFNKKLPQLISSIYFTRYPKHFNNEDYDSKYGKLFNIKKDYYLISILSDGFHQNISFIEFLKCINKLKKVKFRFISLDNYLTIRSIFYSFILYFKLLYKSRQIRSSKKIFNGIDITGFINKELAISIQRIPRLLMYESAIKKIFKKIAIKEFYYYLFEFSYGRFYTYILKKYFPKTTTLGFQHGPNSQRHIMFFLAENEPAMNNNYIYQLPIPDKIFAENKYSKKVYKDGNYNNIEIMENVYRLNYLNDIKRNDVTQNTVLVAAAMHDGNQLLNYLQEEMIKNIDTIYYFKFHPRATQDIQKIKKLNKPNIIAVCDDLTKYLSFVSEVVVTQSSVGYEAYLLEIPVRVISLPNKINDSPLLDINEEEKSGLIEIDYC